MSHLQAGAIVVELGALAAIALFDFINGVRGRRP